MTLEIDIDIMARTLWGEARSEGIDGMEAIAHVVMNRKAVSDQQGGWWWGNTIEEICLKKWQFSCWNDNDVNLKKIKDLTPDNKIFRTALEIAEDACEGVLCSDITNGATHYYNPSGVDRHPDWVILERPVKIIGKHRFYRPKEVPILRTKESEKWKKPKRSFMSWLFAWL